MQRIILVAVLNCACASPFNTDPRLDIDETFVFLNPINFLMLPRDGAGDPSFGLKKPIEPDPMFVLSALRDLPPPQKHPSDKFFLNTVSNTHLNLLNLINEKRTFDRDSTSRLQGNISSNANDSKSKFIPTTFDVDDGKGIKNWTTCNDISDKNFHPTKILNMNWIPFYAWAFDEIKIPMVYKFVIPTKKQVAWYKNELGKYFSPPIDWTQPKLILTYGDVEQLLVAVNRSGAFRTIPKIELPEGIPKDLIIPESTIHMKVEDPYLLMMFCEQLYTMLMAVEGNVPRTDQEKALEARTTGFRGMGLPLSSVPGDIGAQQRK